MQLLYRIVGIGALLVFLPLFGACTGVFQPTACSAGAAAGEWLGEDFWVRADLARVQRELACGADVNANNDHGGTPLHYAAYRNDNSAVIEALLEAGADVNAKNEYGETPLHWAGFNENAAVTEALLNADADVYAKIVGGKTPLHFTAGNSENPAVVEALLEAGADVNARDDGG